MSPAIQNAAFRTSGIDAVYTSFRVRPKDLKSAVQGLRVIGVRGFNVTTPHKTGIIPYLDRVDADAEQSRSVNTVIVDEHGRLTGQNTDGGGALRALQHAGAPLNSEVLLLGSGGAARAIAFSIAPQVTGMKLVNRTLTRAKTLRDALNRRFQQDFTCHSLSQVRTLIPDSGLIINASSMGMAGKSDVPIERDWIRADHWIMDIVYRPRETRLLRLAREANARTIDGLDMLVGQGACSFEIWTGRQAPIAEMRRSLTQMSLAFAHAKSS
jgi:shikimate dehydrogenase